MISYLIPYTNVFPLDDLAARIGKSSNFRFSWQFYRFSGSADPSTIDVREALFAVIASQDLHQFLRDSVGALHDEAFEIQPLHEHCQVVDATDEFENLLASAAGDHLGAYLCTLRQASEAERQEISELFGFAGRYRTYQLVPGKVQGCSTCREYNNHLFSSWFYGVAWDWCLFAVWPERRLLWMGCLSDTD